MNQSFEMLRDELETVLGGLDEQQTQLRPSGDGNRWCIQQVAGHLRLTYGATIEAMDARISKGTATKASPNLMQRVSQFAVIRVGYFPHGRKAPERVTCSTGEIAIPSSPLIARVTEALREMDRRIDAAEAIFGSDRRVISHMILGPLSIDQWRKFHLIHGRHHIKQIWSIRAEHGL